MIDITGKGNACFMHLTQAVDCKVDVRQVKSIDKGNDVGYTTITLQNGSKLHVTEDIENTLLEQETAHKWLEENRVVE